MLYASVTRDAEATRYWVAESKQRIRAQTKNDHMQQVFFLQFYADALAGA